MENLGVVEGALVILILDRVIQVVKTMLEKRSNGNTPLKGDVTHFQLYEQHQLTHQLLRDTAGVLKQVAETLSRITRVEIRP